MYGRMAVIADRHVDQLQRRNHSAHQTQSHSRTATQSAAAMRVEALMASRAVPGETEPRSILRCYNIT